MAIVVHPVIKLIDNMPLLQSYLGECLGFGGKGLQAAQSGEDNITVCDPEALDVTLVNKVRACSNYSRRDTVLPPC